MLKGGLKVRGRQEETAGYAKCPRKGLLVSVALSSIRHGSSHCHPNKGGSTMSEQDIVHKDRQGPCPGVQTDKRKQKKKIKCTNDLRDECHHTVTQGKGVRDNVLTEASE